MAHSHTGDHPEAGNAEVRPGFNVEATLPSFKLGIPLNAIIRSTSDIHFINEFLKFM